MGSDQFITPVLKISLTANTENVGRLDADRERGFATRTKCARQTESQVPPPAAPPTSVLTCFPLWNVVLFPVINVSILLVLTSLGTQISSHTELSLLSIHRVPVIYTLDFVLNVYNFTFFSLYHDTTCSPK